MRQKTLTPTKGTLTLVLALARQGDVIKIPCMTHLMSDDGVPTYEYETLFTCVLLVTGTQVLLSPLYKQITLMEPIVGTRVQYGTVSVALVDEHTRPVSWHAEESCVLLSRRRLDVSRDYFLSLTPDGPVNMTH